MGSQVISPHGSTRRVLDSLRWIIRDLRLQQDRDLSPAQGFVLEVLRERGAMPLGALALATATDPSSVSVVVQKLHDKGLVTKVPDPADRRRQVVALTRDGERAREGAPTPAQVRLIERLESLAPGDRDRLADLLERVAPPEAGQPAPMFLEAP